MKYNSLKDIINHFNLDVNETNASNVRYALVQLLAKLQPEKSGDSFSTEEQKQRYNDIQCAIEDLNILGSQQNAFVSINQVTDIIKAITNAITPGKENEQLNIKLQLKNELQSKINSYYKPIIIGSGTIAGVCIGFIIFSKRLSELSFFTPLLGFLHFNSIILYILFISSTWFLFTWFKEKKDEQRKEWLFSEDGKFVILAEVVKSFGKELENKVIFSFRDFVRAIQGKRKRRKNNLIKVYLSNSYGILYGASIIDISIAEQIARHHLSELENQNVIKKYDVKSIELFYEISNNLIHQLPDRSYYKYFY